MTKKEMKKNVWKKAKITGGGYCKIIGIARRYTSVGVELLYLVKLDTEIYGNGLVITDIVVHPDNLIVQE